MKLLLGPLLGVESDKLYTVCFVTPPNVNSVDVHFSKNKTVTATLIKNLHYGIFWRAEIEIEIPRQGQVIEYALKISEVSISDQNKRNSWSFYIPPKDESPQFIYTSCNGFSSPDLVTKTSDPYRLWKRIKKEQNNRITQFQSENSPTNTPYSILIMGGDQLYADSIWHDVPELKKWCSKSFKEKKAKKESRILTDQVTKFYEKLYFERWNQPETALMLASIPSVMMWDDHDIFDGWGSYPAEVQSWDVHKTIFAAAKSYFELFQIRSSKNKSLIGHTNHHYSFGLKYRKTHILALDNRSQRTIKHVMSTQQWTDIINYLDNAATEGNLLVLSAVPVVYRDFSAVETYFDATPWEEELTDDLKDHWRAKEHQGERMRLIKRLLNNAKQRQKKSLLSKTVILSGDVHVGCLGVITDKTDRHVIKLHQVVSSGIVHPAPSRLAWLGIITSTNDRDECLNEDNTITSKMLTPIHSDRYILSRNYATISTGNDSKLWINWQTENKDKPAYPID
ncbi:MAG: hypothetical protein ACI9LM_002365 [Alteromonadaceae bacterium]|jgi:hypothetical protein